MGEIGRAAGGEPQGNASLGRNCKKVHICLKLKMYLSFIAKKFVFVLPSSRGRATRQRLFFLLLLKMFNSIKQKNTIIRMPSSSHKTTPLLVKRKKTFLHLVYQEATAVCLKSTQVFSTLFTTR